MEAKTTTGLRQIVIFTLQEFRRQTATARPRARNERFVVVTSSLVVLNIKNKKTCNHNQFVSVITVRGVVSATVDEKMEAC